MPLVTATDDAVATVSKPLPLYNVVVHNCDCHTFYDVIGGLVRIVGLGIPEATRKAVEIDHYGSGVVAQVNFELAEHYAARLRDEVISSINTRLITSVEPAT